MRASFYDRQPAPDLCGAATDLRAENRVGH